MKYSVGLQLALHEKLHGVGLFVLTASALFGALSGMVLGRALRLWHLQRRHSVAANSFN